ncbi:alpha/beta hydrolase-fold protein [Mycobacterium sp. OTB74]|uniref:alpha/beta hydrolase n=1 Tax=Mycobacterium sp. OTB74 TaxID=1853452 RepID=UPI002476EE3E|nr:alpha/beta hydrolase-fold protein [Mycobacterium sp. OTB74]MDH6244953.1 S-formylglutathione hydrolase FrmB [Mycobacterium sp. OTB74]
MGQFLTQASLTDGWLPVSIQLISLVILGFAVGRRSRDWHLRRVPIALAAGAALAFALYRYITSLGIAGSPAPLSLWGWTALCGVAASLVVLGWSGGSWRKRGLSLLAVPSCALCMLLVLNIWVGYFPTPYVAWNKLTVGKVPDEVDRWSVTAMQLKGIRPDRGVMLPVTISSDESNFEHRAELVYLPPAWFATNPPPQLPTVMMIGSELNTPSDWIWAGNAKATIDKFAAAHDGNSPVFVFVDATGSFDNDTECVNGARGNASAHLTKEVVPYMISNFGVSPRAKQWGIVGWSMGGTCAVQLTARRPDLFSAFVDIAGDLSPNLGSRSQTITRLYGGDAAKWAEFDPSTVMEQHGHYDGVSALFEVPGTGQTCTAPTPGAPHDAVANPEGQDIAAGTLCAVGERNGIDGEIRSLPGLHDWPFAAEAFADSLPWIGGVLGSPGAPAVKRAGAKL